LSLDSGVILNGGWDALFGTKNGTMMTTLSDGLTVVSGGSKAETLAVKGKLAIQGGSLRVKDVMVQK
jgi:hypothetical protein